MKPEHKRLIMIGAVVAGVFVFWRSCLSVIMLPIWLVTSIFIVLAQPDCGKVITRAGGYDAFRAEAEVAFQTIDLANTSEVDPTNYPPTIAALKPPSSESMRHGKGGSCAGR